MDDTHHMLMMSRIRARFTKLYGQAAADDCLQRLTLLLSCYQDIAAAGGPGDAPRWDQRDNVLITYGDMVRREGEEPLVTLERFLRDRLGDVVTNVHLLPFFPWSSDDGFSVIDYRSVNPKLGAWSHVCRIGESFGLMFDLVLNHCSKHSTWFKDYMTGIAPQRGFFIEMAEGTDLSAVVRPRQSPLLTLALTRSGPRWVWTTFSDDQVDLNFANPDVLMTFLDILLLYVLMGARIIRLDAIAYLWKEVGTPCIHLPQTHEVVKLMRDLLDMVTPRTVLLTETNVPHEQNVSYFGQGDEAHMVYNFSLPPLVLHALHTGSGRQLSDWARGLADPPNGCTWLNFTASHDGIGVRPLEGIVPADDVTKLGDAVTRLGGHVSSKTNTDGTTSPYELNITWFDAMGHPGQNDTKTQTRRFLCSQAIPLAMRGIPAVYFHSLVACANDHEAVERLGYPRAINRHKWHEAQLTARLNDTHSTHARVFKAYKRMLAARRQQSAFHPDAPQRVVDMGDAVFALQRTAMDGRQSILCLHNLTDEPAKVDLPPAWVGGKDLLAAGSTPAAAPANLTLRPYRCAWIVRPNGK